MLEAEGEASVVCFYLYPVVVELGVEKIRHVNENSKECKNRLSRSYRRKTFLQKKQCLCALAL